MKMTLAPMFVYLKYSLYKTVWRTLITSCYKYLIDSLTKQSNGRTHKNFVRKRTLNHLAICYITCDLLINFP